jgi:hypothetical protein
MEAYQPLGADPAVRISSDRDEMIWRRGVIAPVVPAIPSRPSGLQQFASSLLQIVAEERAVRHSILSETARNGCGDHWNLVAKDRSPLRIV